MDRPAETTEPNCIRCGLCLSVCPTYREERALGPLSLEVQRSIKRALDPLGILNPGKLLPARAPTVEP